MKKYTKILPILLASGLVLTACQSPKSEVSTAYDLMGQIKQYKQENLEKISNKEEIKVLAKSRDLEVYYNDLYLQKTVYEYPNVVKMEINELYRDENKTERLSLDKEIYINPKLEVLLNEFEVRENDQGKVDLYGELVIKDKNLTDDEKTYLKEYSQNNPETVTYKDDLISIKIGKN